MEINTAELRQILDSLMKELEVPYFERHRIDKSSNLAEELTQAVALVKHREGGLQIVIGIANVLIEGIEKSRRSSGGLTTCSNCELLKAKCKQYKEGLYAVIDRIREHDSTIQNYVNEIEAGSNAEQIQEILELFARDICSYRLEILRQNVERVLQNHDGNESESVQKLNALISEAESTANRVHKIERKPSFDVFLVEMLEIEPLVKYEKQKFEGLLEVVPQACVGVRGIHKCIELRKSAEEEYFKLVISR